MAKGRRNRLFPRDSRCPIVKRRVFFTADLVLPQRAQSLEFCFPSFLISGIANTNFWFPGWIEPDLALFRILPVVEETTRHYATIRAELKATGPSIPANDAWIAALARQHRLPIVSRDAHFDRVQNVERLAWKK